MLSVVPAKFRLVGLISARVSVQITTDGIRRMLGLGSQVALFLQTGPRSRRVRSVTSLTWGISGACAPMRSPFAVVTPAYWLAYINANWMIAGYTQPFGRLLLGPVKRGVRPSLGETKANTGPFRAEDEFPVMCRRSPGLIIWRAVAAEHIARPGF